MLANRNVRMLVSGQFISALGDQFYLIAMPWLALQLTGSALVAGSLLAVASFPRAGLMLLGGVASDRYSAKTLLIASNGLQAVLMAALGVSMLVPYARLWFLYTLAFVTGTIDAFGLPAFNSLLPRIVPDHELEVGNIYLQGANMTSGVLGPALAGGLISLAAARAGSPSNLDGIGYAFLVNAITFVLGITLFARIRVPEGRPATDGPHESLLDSLSLLVEHVGADGQLKALFGLLLVLGLFLTGTVRVGFPLIAETLGSGGVRDFGNMSSAFGLGLLAGMIGVRLLPRPPRALSGVVVLATFGLVPVGLLLLGLAPPILPTLAIVLVMGAAVGYVFISLLSWLQRRTPSDLLGRIMAVVLFATIGLSPISQLLMGLLLQLNLRATFVGVGSLLLALLVVTGIDRRMWSLRE